MGQTAEPGPVVTGQWPPPGLADLPAAEAAMCLNLERVLYEAGAGGHTREELCHVLRCSSEESTTNTLRLLVRRGRVRAEQKLRETLPGEEMKPEFAFCLAAGPAEEWALYLAGKALKAAERAESEAAAALVKAQETELRVARAAARLAQDQANKARATAEQARAQVASARALVAGGTA